MFIQDTTAYWCLFWQHSLGGSFLASKCVIISLYRPEEIALLRKHSWVMWFLWFHEPHLCSLWLFMWLIIRPFCFTHWHLAVKRSRDAIKAPVVTLESADRCWGLFWSLISSWGLSSDQSESHTHQHHSLCWRCLGAVRLQWFHCVTALLRLWRCWRWQNYGMFCWTLHLIMYCYILYFEQLFHDGL